MNLTAGRGECLRIIPDAEGWLIKYRHDIGLYYLNHLPATSPNSITLEDLAVTLLMNSRAGSSAAVSISRFGHDVDLTEIPDTLLEETASEDRDRTADLIARLSNLPFHGFGASLATKLLHKKRPRLIPVLDNQAIFGAYMNAFWPSSPAGQDTVKSKVRIREALESIYYDITRDENLELWPQLSTIEPSRSRVELFDMIWWIYFRHVQPVRKPSELPGENV